MVMATCEGVLDVLWAGEREGLGWTALLLASSLWKGAVLLYTWGRKVEAWGNWRLQWDRDPHPKVGV